MFFHPKNPQKSGSFSATTSCIFSISSSATKAPLSFRTRTWAAGPRKSRSPNKKKWHRGWGKKWEDLGNLGIDFGDFEWNGRNEDVQSCFLRWTTEINGDRRRSTEIGGALLRSEMQMPAVPGQRAVASTIFLCLTIYNGHNIYIYNYIYASIFMCIYICVWGLSYAYI